MKKSKIDAPAGENEVTGPGRLTRRDLLRYGGTAGMALAVYVSGTNIHGQKKKTMKFMTVSHSVNTAVYAPHLVAKELGYFEENGLDATFVVPGGGARVAQVLAGRQVGFAQGDSSHPLKISEKGKPCAMIYGTDTRCSYANIVVRKELFDAGLNTVEKLATMPRKDGEPRVIAATRIGSGTWVYGNYVLERHKANGKAVNDQVKWVGGGGSSTMLGGLKSGQFDAIMAVPIWMEKAVADGYGMPLFDISSATAWKDVFGGDIPTTVGYALRETIDDDPDVTDGYVKAVYQAMQWLKGRNPDEVYDKIGKKYMGTFTKEQVTNEVKYYQAIFNYNLLVSKTDFENGKKVWVPKATKKDWGYDEVVDMRAVEKAMKG